MLLLDAAKGVRLEDRPRTPTSTNPSTRNRAGMRSLQQADDACHGLGLPRLATHSRNVGFIGFAVSRHCSFPGQDSWTDLGGRRVIGSQTSTNRRKWLQGSCARLHCLFRKFCSLRLAARRAVALSHARPSSTRWMSLSPSLSPSPPLTAPVPSATDGHGRLSPPDHFPRPWTAS